MSRQDREPSTSPTLLRSAKSGNGESWRQLAQIYGPIIYGWARRCGCQEADAADVMQDTLASMASAIDTFDHSGPGATFRGWLWTITRNKLRDRARREDWAGAGGTAANLQMQQITDPSGKDSFSSDSVFESADPPSEAQSDLHAVRLRALEMLREQFEPRSWKMFWETEALGRSPADVAEDLGVSKWAVYKARARVLSRLRQELQGLEPSEG